MRCQPGNALAALQQSINRTERTLHYLLYAHKAPANSLFGELKKRSFDVAKYLLGWVRLLGGAGNCGIRSVNNSSQHCLVPDDADIVLNAGAIGDANHQLSDIACIAHRFQFAMLIQSMCERNGVRGLRSLSKFRNTRVDSAV